MNQPETQPFAFTIIAREGRARLGRISTPHGVVDTPAFMPVGTRATVKGLTAAQLRATGTQIVLANTYHLLLRPGADEVQRLGGLQKMTDWRGPMLTDSGGFQVFSLNDLRKVDDDGATFQSHIDGQIIRITPESATQIQQQLGADIIMAFDECPPLPAESAVVERAVRRSIDWAGRCRDAHRLPQQALYGIVQGGLDVHLRRRCLAALVAIGFEGYALGGLSVGEPPPQMWAFLDEFAHEMPADRPRYLMGVGTPRDLVEAVHAGVDQFDCVLPTRNGRKGYAFTSRGVVRLKNAVHRGEAGPLDAACDCETCRGYSRGYLRHLFIVEEALGPTLVSIHNLAFYQRLMREMRAAIAEGRFATWRQTFLGGPLAQARKDEE